ncbi:MAG: hypothetical protein AB1847_17770 [bacterium]
MRVTSIMVTVFGIMMVFWPVCGRAYYGSYGGYASYASPYRSYGYPYSFSTGGGGYYGLGTGGLYNLYGLGGLGLSVLGLYGSGLYSSRLYSLGLYGSGLYGLGLYGSGLYGLGALGLYGLGGLNSLQVQSNPFGSSGSNGLRAYGLQLLASGGMGNLGWQSLLLAAMFSSPEPEVAGSAASTATAAP